MVIQLATLLLVSIHKQGMEVQLQSRGCKAGRYVIELNGMHEELRKVESNPRHYLLQLSLGGCVCMPAHTNVGTCNKREKRV